MTPLSVFSLSLDYAVHIFHDVARKGQYECFLRKDTRLPMIYIQDCLESVVKFMEQPQDNLKLRTYNVTATSFTPDELVNEMKKHFPNMEVIYKPDKRQDIGNLYLHLHYIKLLNYIFITIS